MGEVGVPVLCYNFMPVFDWTRTDLALRSADGSTALAYDDDALVAHRPLARHGRPARMGDGLRRRDAARAARRVSRRCTEERLWENLAYFLERVVPVAESAGVKMAIHPDDPPWSIFGLPRIVTSGNGARSSHAARRLARRTASRSAPAPSAPIRRTICRRSCDVSDRAAAFTSRIAAT